MRSPSGEVLATYGGGSVVAKAPSLPDLAGCRWRRSHSQRLRDAAVRGTQSRGRKDVEEDGDATMGVRDRDGCAFLWWSRCECQRADPGSTGIETTAERLVDLNQATAVELETLPGIGERTAARIIAYRQAHEGFEKVEELMNIQGIGERTFLRLRPFIMLTAARPSAAGAQRSGNGR